MSTESEQSKVILDGIKLTPQQRQLLEQAYQDRNIVQATVFHQYNDGKSGASVYLIKVDKHNSIGLREIAKFDHPYVLAQELNAYRNVVAESAKKYRATLEYPPIPQKDSDEPIVVPSLPPDTNEPDALGVLIFSFQGTKDTTRVDSLKEYYEKNRGEETAKALQLLEREFLSSWWTSLSGTANSYANEYDRLLPVHLEVEATESAIGRTTLQTRHFDGSDIQQLNAGAIVELCDFTLTSTRDDVLRLLGKPQSNIIYPDVRIKLKPQNRAMLHSLEWGSTLDMQFARVSKTRADILHELALDASVQFVNDDSDIIIDSTTYGNPLLAVNDILLKQEMDGQQIRVGLSTVHGDLNLKNVIVDGTGYPFVIDFAHTSASGSRFIDLQRLEDHVVAEILAPEMKEKGIKVSVYASILQSLDNKIHPNNLPPNLNELKEPYWVLYTIRELVDKYQPSTSKEYYRGLYLVMIGGLKYKERNEYQRKLSLIGAASLLTNISPSPPPPPPQPPFWRKLMKNLSSVALGFLIAAVLLLGSERLGLLTIVGPRGTNPPSPASAERAADGTQPYTITVTSPTVSVALSPTTPAPSVTMTSTVGAIITETPEPQISTLKKVIERGYLRCGIPENTPGFGEIEGELSKKDDLVQEDKGRNFYDKARGIEASLCEAMASAIFGQFTDHVKFIALSPTSESGIGRFDAVREGIVDIAFRNTTVTEKRDLEEDVDFLQVYYIDTIAFLYNSTEVRKRVNEMGGPDINLEPVTKMATYKLLEMLQIPVCVQPETTTALELEKMGNIQLKMDSSFNTESLRSAYINKDCIIIALDRGQIEALKKDNENFAQAQIIPITRTMITLEPLAPFIKENDSQWRDILNAVIRTMLYADQMEISKELLDKLDRRNVEQETIDTVLNSLVENNGALRRDEYEEFLGLSSNSTKHPIDEMIDNSEKGNFRFRILSQVGSYTDIFTDAFGIEPFPPNQVVDLLNENADGPVPALNPLPR